MPTCQHPPNTKHSTYQLLAQPLQQQYASPFPPWYILSLEDNTSSFMPDVAATCHPWVWHGALSTCQPLPTYQLQ